MKKRILSMLLILCTVAALLPVSVTTAETTATAEDTVPHVSSYLDLYVTDGLVVLFDAGSASADTVDLENGLWYGMTAVNGVLTKNESYQATLVGGAYDADTNPFGWQAVNGGLTWNEPDTMSATDNRLQFESEWLPEHFEVELLFAPYMRNSNLSAYTAETVTNITSTAVTVGTTYTITRTTCWYSGAIDGSTLTLHLSGTAGETVTLSQGTSNDGGTRTSTVDWGSVTFDGNGKATLAKKVAYKNITVTLPTGVTLDSVEANVHSGDCGYDQAMVIGNLYGYCWTNLRASNTWGNGFGTTRWTVANNSWNAGAAYQTGAGVLTTNTAICDSSSFATYNGAVALFSVANDGTRYNVTHGEMTVLDKTLNGTAATGGDFKILHRLPGAAYGARVYNRVLSEEEKAQNAFADLCARYGLDVTGISKEAVTELSHIYRYFAEAYSYEGENAADMQAMLDNLLKVAKSATPYDALYVQNGLVGLYTAYGTDDKGGEASLVISNGKVTNWVDRIAGEMATVSGNFVANYDKDGGFGIAPQTYDAWSTNHNFGVTFSNSYADLEDFTVENVIRYRPHTTNHASSGDSQFDTTFAGMRYDVIAGLVWNTNPSINSTWAFHVRTYLSNNVWGNSSCSATRYRLDGGSSGYVGNGYTLTPDKLITHTFYKDNDGTNVYFGIYIDNIVTKQRTETGVNNEGTITVAQYNAVKAGSGLTSGRFSNLNGVSGSMYAVRVYNRKLTAAESAQNHAVDLLAYFNVDVSKLTAAGFANNAPLIETVAAYTFDTGSTAYLQALVDQAAPDELTEYDKLYVSDGLVGLFSAFGTDDGALITDSKTGYVIAWQNKVGNDVATVNGPFTAGYDTDGGFGTRLSHTEWNTWNTTMGVTFNDAYADLPDFTVENIVRYRSVSDNLNGTGNIFNASNYTSFRFDLYAGVAFNQPEDFHIRAYLGNGHWNASNSSNGTVSLCTNGQTGYVGNGFYPGNGTLINHTFTKDTSSTSVAFSMTVNEAIQYYHNGVGSAGSITTAQYNTLRNASTSNTSGKFSNFNGLGGTAYAVRIYNRVLTAEERAQNHAVDLMAYLGVDVSSYPTDPYKRAWIAEQLSDYTFATAQKDTVQSIVNANLVTVYFYSENGALVEAYVTKSGSDITLPASLNGTAVTVWNGNLLPGATMQVTSDIAFTGTKACPSHDFANATVMLAPTHTAEGQRSLTCSLCGTVKLETISKLAGHEYGAWETVNETRHQHVCACGEIEHAPHAYDAGRITLAPTYESTGKKLYTCVDCGRTYEETLPALTAQQNAFTLALSEAEGKGGDTVSVTVTATNNPGFSYMLLSLTYDTDVLTLVEAETPISALTVAMGNGPVSLDASQNCAENGVLCTLTFLIEEEAKSDEYAVGLSVSQCFDENTAIVSVTATGGTVLVKNALYGDVNGDGEIDGKDVIALRQYLVGNGTVAEGADANGDGEVDGKDVILLRQYLVGSAALGPTA